MQPPVEQSFLWADTIVKLAKKGNAYLRTSGTNLFKESQYLKKALGESKDQQQGIVSF